MERWFVTCVDDDGTVVATHGYFTGHERALAYARSVNPSRIPQGVKATHDFFDYATSKKPIDYRKLLKAYIKHVGACEGVDFLTYHDGVIDGLTAAESDELRRLADEDRTPLRCQARAHDEGWGLFEVDGRWQLQRSDDRNVFPTDADAVCYVADRAQGGSPYHRAAIEAIGTLVDR